MTTNTTTTNATTTNTANATNTLALQLEARRTRWGADGFPLGLRIRCGGSTGSRGNRHGDFVGPLLATRGYKTVANGCASDIEAMDGEIAIQYRKGDAYSFSCYAMGDAQIVLAALIWRFPERTAEWKERVTKLVAR
jgi:hypothetical protein